MRPAAALLACIAAAIPLPALAQGLDTALADGTVLQVTGVAASDVLNVRRAPSANAPIVGALSPLADFVILRERRGAWTRIEYTRGVSIPVRGWVASRYLELATNNAGPDNGVWACHGTEPFWNVWIEDGQVRYRDDNGTIVSPLTDLYASANEPSSTWTFRFSRGYDRTIAVMIDGQACNDGMSEVSTRRTLLLTGPEGGVVNGCCRRPVADERPPEPSQSDPPSDPPQE